jgi:hypothetical protein
MIRGAVVVDVKCEAVSRELAEELARMTELSTWKMESSRRCKTLKESNRYCTRHRGRKYFKGIKS